MNHSVLPPSLPVNPAKARPAAASGDDRGVDLPRLSSRDLLGQGREVEIEHEAMLYRLRVTALGKLILTK